MRYYQPKDPQHDFYMQREGNRVNERIVKKVRPIAIILIPLYVVVCVVGYFTPFTITEFWLNIGCTIGVVALASLFICITLLWGSPSFQGKGWIGIVGIFLGVIFLIFSWSPKKDIYIVGSDNKFKLLYGYGYTTVNGQELPPQESGKFFVNTSDDINFCIRRCTYDVTSTVHRVGTYGWAVNADDKLKRLPNNDPIVGIIQPGTYFVLENNIIHPYIGCPKVDYLLKHETVYGNQFDVYYVDYYSPDMLYLLEDKNMVLQLEENDKTRNPVKERTDVNIEYVYGR